MLVLNSFIHKYPSRTVLCTHTFLLLLCECYSHVGVLCFRILLRHRHQPDRGPEVHLHPPYGVSEGPGDVHVPDAAELGEGADARLQTRLRQHHSGRLHHWMPVCTDRGRPEPEAAETVVVTLDRLALMNQWITAWSTHRKTTQYLNCSSPCTSWQWNVHFSLDSAWKEFLALVCLHSAHYLFQGLYQFSPVSAVAGFMFRWPEQ